MSLISVILPNIQTLLLMPILWVMAFCMSYPQMHYKELITMSVNQFVATEAVIPFSDWIGTIGKSTQNQFKLSSQVFTMSWTAVSRTKL